jgi:6,7-dimethyl-8-ribityllumazine synthase
MAPTRTTCHRLVPGAFELPLAVRRLAGRAGSMRSSAGLVLKGDTAHHEVVTSEAVHGIAAAALATGVPWPLGIVSAETTEQAIERCGSKQGNRGWDAAMAALEMVNVVGWIKSLESRVSDPPVTTVDAAPADRAAAAGKAAPRRRVRKRVAEAGVGFAFVMESDESWSEVALAGARRVLKALYGHGVR